MATGPLSIKLRCASWQQLATIYKRDLSRGTMFLKAGSPPPIGTEVRIDLTLPSASVIVLTGVVDQHVTDPQRGGGVELKLAPILASSVWMIESALASETKRRNTPAAGMPVVSPGRHGGASANAADPSPGMSGPIPAIGDSEDVIAAEQDLIKALLSEADSLRKLNPFLVLGVGYEATDSDVRAAFGELTKRYHPDLFARYESAELRQVAAEIFILIRDAYRKLGDEGARSQALASLGRPAAAPRAVPLRAPTPLPVPIGPPKPRPTTTGQIPRPVPEPPLPPPPIPRIPRLDVPRAIQDGTPTMRPGEAPPPPTAAVPPVASARSQPIPTVPMPPDGRSQPIPSMPMPPDGRSQPIPSMPSTPSRTPGHGVPRTPTAAPPIQHAAESSSETSHIDELLEQGKFEEAAGAYKLLAKKHPADRSYRAGVEVCEGLRAIAARDRLEAAQRFEAALEMDPSNERAARELADMRRQATNERKGLLTRLMGKKE